MGLPRSTTKCFVLLNLHSMNHWWWCLLLNLGCSFRLPAPNFQNSVGIANIVDLRKKKKKLIILFFLFTVIEWAIRIINTATYSFLSLIRWACKLNMGLNYFQDKIIQCENMRSYVSLVISAGHAQCSSINFCVYL